LGQSTILQCSKLYDVVRITTGALRLGLARVVIGSAIVSALETLDLRFPRADKASLQEFKQVRKALEEEGKGSAAKKKAAGKVARN
jgi:hypothetical protein